MPIIHRSLLAVIPLLSISVAVAAQAPASGESAVPAPISPSEPLIPPAPAQRPGVTVRDVVLQPPIPIDGAPRHTRYGHPAPPLPRYTGAWESGWKAWRPSGGVDGLGYWYQYHTHVPNVGLTYYRGPVARYQPASLGVSPATGYSHYGYGPLGW